MNKTINKRRLSQNKSPQTSIDSDSFTSFFVSWQKNRAPPIYPNAQTGRIVAAAEFYLFNVAVILLVITLGLTSMSIWSLLIKTPYSFFINWSTELAYFALPVAFLCLPCFWIVFSVHNDKKSWKFLSLVLVILVFSILLMGIGVYVGFTHKLHLSFSQVESNPVLREFRESMRQSMKSYERGQAWDEIQTRLGCCGVDNYTDWLAVRENVPESCCREICGENTDNNAWSTGCLKIIVATLTSQTYLFNGINCVALFLQCWAFLIITVIYFRCKHVDAE